MQVSRKNSLASYDMGKKIQLFDVQKQKKEKKYSLLGSDFFLLFDRRFKLENFLPCEPKLQDSVKAQQLELI